MKTLLIAYDFPPMVSGIGTYMYNLWRFMPRDQTIILAPNTKGDRQPDQADNMRVIRYPDISSLRIIRVAVLFHYILYLIVKERIEFLICSVPVSLGLIGLIFNKFFGIPYCVFYYGGELSKYRNNRIITRVLKTVLRNAKCVISISEFTSNEVIKFGIEEKNIFKITPGVDSERFKPGIDCSRLRKKFNLEYKMVLLTVSRLVKRKGIDAMILALPEILKKAPNTVYIIAGKGEEETFLRALTIKNKLENNIIFAGYIPDEELPLYYNLCDVFVLPNRETFTQETFEGFGISFIEASACAKPVIGGISGGVRDAVLDGETGVLVDPDDTALLASTVIKVLTDRPYALMLGLKGRERVQKDFKWISRTNSLMDIFQRSTRID